MPASGAVLTEKIAADSAAAGAQRVGRGEQDNAVPSEGNTGTANPAAQQAQTRTATVKAEQAHGMTVQSLQPGKEDDAIDITADDTDSSQLGVEPGLNSAAADVVEVAAPAAEATVAQVNQDSAAVHPVDAAEAFISLEPEAGTASTAVSPTNHTQLAQAAQGSQSTDMPSHWAADATATAVANGAAGNSIAEASDSLTVPGLQPLPAHRKAPPATTSADSRPASANGRPASAHPAAASSALYPDQKALPASKAKAAGKGGIQIVMATKHKEVRFAPQIQSTLPVAVQVRAVRSHGAYYVGIVHTAHGQGQGPPCSGALAPACS